VGVADTSVILDMELGCQVFIKIPETDKQFTSYLVGKENGRYLIIKTPAPLEGAYRLPEDVNFQVRYTRMGEIYGFESSVIQRIPEPFALSFLTYPDRVEHVNLRKFPRISCCIPATMDCRGFSHAGVILDISRKGCRFFLKGIDALGTLPRVGDNIRISFPIFEIEGIRDFEGTVRNLGTDPRGDSIGIEFFNVAAEIARKIDSFIEAALAHSV
jgi:c-di-GMP-binding flagellar brake protein YcgR